VETAIIVTGIPARPAGFISPPQTFPAIADPAPPMAQARTLSGCLSNAPDDLPAIPHTIDHAVTQKSQSFTPHARFSPF
jgi:hypothetical protein